MNAKSPTRRANKSAASKTARTPRRVAKRSVVSSKVAKPAARVTRAFAPEEFVRVVPLHYPKPTIPLAELQRRAEEGDVFDGGPQIAPAGAKLTYRNGPLLTAVEIYTIFWGQKWATSASGKAMATKLDDFFGTIVQSSLLDQLAEYSVTGKKIGRGKYTGTKTITANAPTSSVTDTQIRAQIKKWITAGTIPKNGKNTLYFVFLDPNVVVTMGGSKSCQSFCGYHNNAGSIYYAVMPYPSCAGCLGGMAAFDALTGTSSHEMCEAITDPIPGSGWYDDKNGEIGDICAWNFKKVAGYTVQLEWSNAQNKCV